MAHRRILGRALLAAAITVTAVTALGDPAHAVPTCDIGQFPNIQAAQSDLRVSCLFANGATAGTNEVSSTFTMHDFQNAEYHQGAARTAKVTVAALAGTGAITAAAGHFGAADLNHPVSGTGIPARAFIKSVTATTITLNVAHLAVPLNTVLTIENSDARTVADIVTVAGSKTVTSATANFKTSDIGKSITASTLADGSTITAVGTPTGGTTATVSLNALASTAGGYPVGCTSGGLLPTCNPPVATIGQTQAQTTTRAVTDATQTTSTITSANAKWGPGDVGLKVIGAGIPATAYIASYSGNVATIAGGALTANATAHALTIGEPGATAPANGSAVLDMMTTLDLNPALAGGSGNCGSNIPEGFEQQGTWYNPGSFVPVGIYGPQPTTGQTIAQITFTNPVITVGAWLQKMPAATPGDPQAAAHYDLVFPMVTPAFAACPAPNTVGVAISIKVHATAVSQALVPAGVGRPYSAQVRYLAPGSLGAKTATFKSNNATAPKNWAIAKSCTIPAINAAVAYTCGFA